MLLSGVLGAAIDRLTVKAATNQTYLDATVTTADLSGSRYKTSGDAALIARARQLVLTYASFNARQCAGSMLRLYAKKKSKGTKAVKGRRRNEYLRSPSMGPGIKAARWADMAGDVQEVVDHPALSLLNSANPWMRGTTFFLYCFMQCEIFGRRYIHTVGEGEPEELWPMGAQSVKIIPSQDGLIAGYRYGRSGEQEVDFTADEVLYHRMFPSPYNPYDALSPMHAIVDECDIYSAATISELATWQNGARPDWVLSVPKDANTSEPQLRALEAKINATMRGPRKRGQFLVTSLVEPKALQFTPKEMEYLAGKADIRKSIRAAFGIPESMDELNSANLASAQMGHAQYARYTLSPRLNQDAEEWTETLLPRYGIEPGEMWFAYDNPIPADEAAIRADAQTYVPLGVWSVNEVREELGFDTLPDPKADEHKLESPPPMGFGAFGTPPARGGADDEEDDDDVGGNAGPQGREEDEDDAPPSTSKSLPAPASCGCGGKCGCKSKATRRQVKDDRFAETAKQRKLTEEMQRAVEKWYTTISAANIISTGGAIDLTLYEGQLAEALRPFIAQMFAEGVRDGLVSMNQTRDDAFDIFPDRAVGFVNQYTVQLAREISASTQDELRMALADGLAEGVNLDDVTNRVQVALGESAKWKAERIARTEIMRAQNEGELEAMKALGIEKKQWLLSPGPCPKCEAVSAMFADGVKVGDPFLKVGDSFMDSAGDMTTVTYRNVNVPPLHPNCRCKIVGIL